MSQDRRIRRRVASLDNRYAHQLLSQFPVPGETEDQLVAGLDIILDYLNHGNGAPALNYLRERADRWTVTHNHGTAVDDYHAFRDAAQGGRAVAAAAPQRVLDVHPNFFDLREISWLRLDSTPPEFMHESGSDDSSSSEDESHEYDDDGDSYESDAVSVQGDEFRLPPSIDDLSSNSSSSEESPPYEEPALPPQQQQQQPEAAALRLVRRCDLERKTTALRLIVSRLIADSAASSYSHEQSAAAIASAVGRRRDEVRIRATDLLDSPVLYHIPALLAHLASLSPVPTYVEQMRRHSMLVRDEQAGQRVSEVRAQSRGTLLISPPPSDGANEDDDGGLQSPVLLPCFSLPEIITTATTATTAAAAAPSSSALKRLHNDEYNLHDRDYQEAQGYEEVPLTPSAKRRRGPWNLWGLIGR